MPCPHAGNAARVPAMSHSSPVAGTLSAHPHSFTFAGACFHALPDRALYWPEQRALLVADLHLEKGSWYAQRGQLLPPFDSQATLERLEALVDRLNPRSIWALGDSFHDSAGPDRLANAAIAAIARMAAGRAMIWIAGNHDGAAALPGDRADEAVLGGIVLRHEADPSETRPEISGHFHPKLRIAGSRRPCFVLDHQRMILPAFGALTGGLDADDPAIRKLFASDARAIVPTRERACSFALTTALSKRPSPHHHVAGMSHPAE
jgi:DNA ligase-associated metallophosphoesterase